MNDNNKAEVEVLGIINPADMEIDFKKLKYIESISVGDKTVSLSEMDEYGYIYMDCVKGEMQIRIAMDISAKDKLSLGFYTKYVSDEAIDEVKTYIDNNYHEELDLGEMTQLILKALKEVIF